MEDLQGVDLPELINKSGRVIGNKCSTCGIASRCCTSFSSPNSITEITTEVSVDDDLLVEEVVFDVGTIATEVLNRSAPSAWVWVATVNVPWIVGSRETPDFDGVFGPLHGENTSAVVVETLTVLRGVSVCDSTTGRVGAGGCIITTVCCLNRTGHAQRGVDDA